MKKYRQKEVAEEDMIATWAKLKIEGQWVDGILLNKDGKELPFPCEVREGENYMVEAKEGDKE